MKIEIDLEQLFLQKLKSGINLFTGAGFSTLPSPTGEKLPTGDQLCSELIQEFKLNDVQENQGLSYISEFCPEHNCQNYLRKRFTLTSYNPLYDVLNKINLKSYITTNVDNIIRLVMDKSTRYYLKNIREYGASMNGSNELTFIPLHGDVADETSKLYFGEFDLAIVDKQNSNLFDLMFGTLAKKPILFCGYSFRDKGVLSTVKRLIDLGTSDIWIQFLPTETAAIRLFENKGCHIIKSDTESLLKWMDMKLGSISLPIQDSFSDPRLKDYEIPTISKVTSIPQAEYFQEGNTTWHPILTGTPAERPIVSVVEDAALTNKNIIITGCRFSGKTTTLMQLARKIDSRNKFYINGISKEEADFLINVIGEKDAWFFFNNCTDNIEAFNRLAAHKTYYVIGTANDYHFETVKHLIDANISYKVFDCSELLKEEAQQVYNKVPLGIRKNSFEYKHNNNERYSMFEFTALNIAGAYVKKRVSEMLKTLKEEDFTSFTIIVLALYLSENGSALSYLNIANYFNVSAAPTAFHMIKKVKNYLRLYNFEKDLDSSNEDFFVLRSKLFSISAKTVLIEEYRDVFATLIKNFINREVSCNIARYNVFKRKAYDAHLFAKIFKKDEAVALYKYIYESDKSPYALQQLALCLAAYKDYKEAFIQIDKAISEQPHNFSFRNSQAIIMFESNKDIGSVEAIEYMHKSMDILRECYSDDKRKLYHAQRFAEFAIFFSEKYCDHKYLSDAKIWLLESLATSPYNKSSIDRLVEKITDILSML